MHPFFNLHMFRTSDHPHCFGVAHNTLPLLEFRALDATSLLDPETLDSKRSEAEVGGVNKWMADRCAAQQINIFFKPLALRET